MGLRDLAIPTAEVTVSPGSKFAVRGFSLNDALGLYYRHTGQISNLFDEFAGRVKAGGSVTASDVGVALTSGAPRVLAEIIATAYGLKADASNWDEEVSAVVDFPAAVQIDALQKIADLTFSSDMPPGKFAGLVLAMARSALAARSNPSSLTSEPGSGESEDR